jgi:hypothetical protein
MATTFPRRYQTDDIAAPGMCNDKAGAINIANGDEPIFTIVSSQIGLQHDRSFENKGCDPEVDIVFLDVRDAFSFVPLVLHVPPHTSFGFISCTRNVYILSNFYTRI